MHKPVYFHDPRTGKQRKVPYQQPSKLGISPDNACSSSASRNKNENESNWRGVKWGQPGVWTRINGVPYTEVKRADHDRPWNSDINTNPGFAPKSKERPVTEKGASRKPRPSSASARAKKDQEVTPKIGGTIPSQQRGTRGGGSLSQAFGMPSGYRREHRF